MKTRKMHCKARPLAWIATLLYASQCAASLQPAGEAPLARSVQTSCRVNADLSSDCVAAVQIHVLRPAGLDLVHRIDLTADGLDTLSVQKAALIQPDGTRLPLPGDRITSQAGDGQGDGGKHAATTSLVFDGLAVGGGLEYTVEQHYARIPGVRQFHGVMAFPPLPLREDGFRLEYAAEQPIVWRSEDFDDFNVVTSDGGKRLLVQLAHPRYFNLVNEDAFTLRRIPRIEFGYSDQVQDHFGKLAHIYSRILDAPLPPDAAAEVATLRGRPQDQQVISVMAFIRDRYRYRAGWRLSDRGLIPTSLGRIEEDGYGDSKDLAYLLAAMLRKLGMQAVPALVAKGSFAPALLIPGVHAPDHVIVRAHVNGKSWWLDPANPDFLPGHTASYLQDRWAILLEADGKASVASIPMELVRLTSDRLIEKSYLPDGTSQASDKAAINGFDLLKLAALDRAQGSAAGDQKLCAAVARQPEACAVRRLPTDKAVAGPYAVEARAKDARPLEKSAGKFLYDASGYFQLDMAAFSDYRKSHGVGDAYLGDAGVLQTKVRLDGLRADRKMPSCRVRSPWIDYEVSRDGDAGHAVSYTSRYTQKVRWISHDDLRGVEFGKFMADASACLANLKLGLSP